MRAAFDPPVGVELPHRMTPRYRWLRESLHKNICLKRRRRPCMRCFVANKDLDLNCHFLLKHRFL